MERPLAETALPELQVESLAAGGDGVGRLEGQAVFVAGAVPGDRLRVRLGQRRARWAKAEIVEILEPGPGRRSAPCPVADDCGGCQWQQVDDALQREARRDIVLDALTRIAGLDAAALPPVDLPAPTPGLGYRRRAEYRLQSLGGGRVELGFLARGSHRLVDHERCLLLEAPLADAVASLRETLVRNLVRPAAALLELTLLEGAGGGSPELQLLATLDDAARRVLPPLLADWRPPGVGAVHVALRDAEGHTLREAQGAPFLLERVQLDAPGGQRLDYPLYTRPGEFVQASRAANRQLLDALLGIFDPGGEPWVLDLFCGAGNLSLPLALLGAKVLGLETRRSALRSARKSARDARCARARFRAGEVAELLPELAADGRKYRTVLLDPPRQGAPELEAQLDPLGVEEIIAVSCHPASFARDLGGWVGRGFALRELQLFDFFPQTHHVELLARLTRA
ncbi:MAG: methyltransferase domain-containing protein [Candidatus Krumholzibacteriia bacterium]|nr:class I SAM-dependent RNA methyltransferase [bacterium]MCB9513749.1 class I SAM-dependent RNA methyltransferase [Candidatus Latescibacterota bacterium]